LNRSWAEFLEQEYAILLRQIDKREPPFGQWMIGLWPPLPVLKRTFELNDQKEAFFLMLERLLRDERIVLAIPGSIGEDTLLCQSREQGGWSDVWTIPLDNQLEHVISHFPQDAASVDDQKIADFFYGTQCPIVGWVDPETREIMSS